MSRVEGEARRRRTFAIISHPDAGKTTLTEKLLLYSGALQEAGAVKARAGRRAVTSDWMALERERGISITSTALQFHHDGCVVNLLDTPGHRDFSEDTYRVLAAADAAVMVLDAAKGVEAQTLKLFEVAHERHLPLVTFVNKFDRPGRESLELLDDIERAIGVVPTPLTWPVGIAGDLRGVVDRRTGRYHRYDRTPRGATMAPVEILDADAAAELEGDVWRVATEELGLLEAIGADHDPARYAVGATTPVLFGSALTNFGVGMLADRIVELVPPPSARESDEGRPVPVDGPFAGLVFKVQANMDPAHRDRVAFLRVCSGRFERGMALVNARTGRAVGTKYAHQLFGAERDTVEESYPGDVVGLANAGDVRVGDTLHGEVPVRFPAIPSFTPELFATARPRDVARSKQFHRGLDQLVEEGVLQRFRRRADDPVPVVGVVGPMQFDVARHRLEHEFKGPAELDDLPWIDPVRLPDGEELDGEHGVVVLVRDDGVRVAAFQGAASRRRLERDRPELFGT